MRQGGWLQSFKVVTLESKFLCIRRQPSTQVYHVCLQCDRNAAASRTHFHHMARPVTTSHWKRVFTRSPCAAGGPTPWCPALCSQSYVESSAPGYTQQRRRPLLHCRQALAVHSIACSPHAILACSLRTWHVCAAQAIIAPGTSETQPQPDLVQSAACECAAALVVRQSCTRPQCDAVRYR